MDGYQPLDSFRADDADASDSGPRSEEEITSAFLGGLARGGPARPRPGSRRSARAVEEIQQQLVDRVGAVELQPVSGVLHSGVPPRTGHERAGGHYRPLEEEAVQLGAPPRLGRRSHSGGTSGPRP